jgi:hypothetical protein
MGSTTIPAVTPWLELGTASPTTGSVVTFTSIPEYNNYRMQWFGINQSGPGSNYGIRFNGDSGTNYATAASGFINNPDTSIIIDNNTGELQMDIKEANEITKRIDGFSGETNTGSFKALWNNQSKITEISVTLLTSGTFSSGTIKIFGKN